MKKIIILFVVLNAFLTNTFSKENYKAIEFSIVGGFSQTAIFAVSNSNTYMENTPFNITYESEIYPPRIMSLLFSLPTSFVYYPVKHFGIGIMYSIGLNLNLVEGYMPCIFEIINKVGIINKFGSQKKKVYFLSEYYLSIIGRIRFLRYSTSEIDNTIFDFELVSYTDLNPILIQELLEKE